MLAGLDVFVREAAAYNVAVAARQADPAPRTLIKRAQRSPFVKVTEDVVHLAPYVLVTTILAFQDRRARVLGECPAVHGLNELLAPVATIDGRLAVDRAASRTRRLRKLCWRRRRG
jgi:hypothetical protein